MIIDLSNQKLKRLPPISPNIRNIVCNCNKIKNIKLTYLESFGSIEPKIPNSQSSLYSIKPDGFGIFDSIEIFNCYTNKIRKLPYSSNIKQIWCADNRIKRITYYPNIVNLWCGNYVKDYSYHIKHKNKNKYINFINVKND